MSPGLTLPDVAIPICELQFGLQEALQRQQRKKIRTVQGKKYL